MFCYNFSKIVGIEEKKRALEEIFTSFFQQEVLQLGNFRKNEVIRDLILLLIQRLGSKVDIQKISRELGIRRPTLYDYIAFLEGTFFIKTLRPFTKGKDSEIRKMPKVYICDSGLANYLVNLDSGLLFENSVFQNLRQKGELNYFQKKRGSEINFVLNKEIAYEVKATPHLSDINRIERVSKELSLKGFNLVSKSYVAYDNVIYGFML